MIRAERSAQVIWDGDLEQGKGRATMATGAIGDFGVSWPSRIEEPGGNTSPEELIAAAHASCFSMALAGELAQAGVTPERLTTTAKALLDDTGPGLSIKRMELTVRGRVPGADLEAFRRAAEAAKEGCPVSKALKNNVELTVQADLEA